MLGDTPFNLQTIQIAVAIVIGLLTILSTIFGWFGKVLRWVSSAFKSKPPVGIIDVPKKTMVLIPESRQNALWWHMGSKVDQPIMQIVGDLTVTNISKYGVFIAGAKLRKPKTVGHASVRGQNSNMIPQGGVSGLRFLFFVQPPRCEKGETFRADVAIIDQFGNKHWLKRLEFPYI